DDRDFLLDQVKIAERLVELFPRVRVFDCQIETSFRRAGATSAERGAPEIQNRERDFQTLAERAENVFLRHFYVSQCEFARGRSADTDFSHSSVEQIESRHVRRD